MRKLNANERRAYIEELALARVAVRLADAIERSNKSQREIADALDITEARISQIVNLKGNPTVSSLARLADVLGCELDISFKEGNQIPALVAPEEAGILSSEGAWNVREATWCSSNPLSDMGYANEDINEAA
jgi:transcriptional regulator with XRE-family HTH domain